MGKMKAIEITQFGGPEVLKVAEVDIGTPGRTQALVRLVRIGVNFVDIFHRRGSLPTPVKTPFIPGWEGAGVVDAVGKDVKNVKPGDRVAYVHEPGAYAEYSVVEADRLIPIPDSFSFDQAAAFPLQGMTAHYLLHEFREINVSDFVLIHAAAGGMGLLLVQWAKHLGAQVIGTVSTKEKENAVLEAGAQHVINYHTQDFVPEVKKFTNQKGANLIIDGVGKSTFIKNLDAATLRGTIVTYGFASGPPEPLLPAALMQKSLSISGGNLSNFIATPEELKHRAKAVIEAIQEKWLKITIDRILPLENASEAHRLLENRQTIGKILLATDYSP